MNKGLKPLLGAYGPWMADAFGTRYEYSFPNERWTDVSAWSRDARALFSSYVLSPDLVMPKVELEDRRTLDGLVIEKLSWRLPFGPKTEAYFLKPHGSSGRLPAVLALHDHGANKYFGKQKIATASETVHPYVQSYRDVYYGGRAWANELAKRGYGVLVHDIFPFESRKIIASELPGLVVERMMLPPEELKELTPDDLQSGSICTEFDVSETETSEEIDRYNAFAGQYESTIAKSLFSAGFTWPGIVLAEDRIALDYLASRPDIDPERIGCGGLSGGGLRTNYLAGSDSRIRCSVTAGFMTTWSDFVMNTSYTHTWMIYVPGLSRYMDYPDILAMRTPLPSLVQSTRHDPLFTQSEVHRAESVLQNTYLKAGFSDRFKMSYYDGPHKFDVPMQEEAFAWFDRWL